MKDNETSASGVEGYLLRIGGTLVFRVYDPNDKRQFKDYTILHHDLKVKIMDDYSSFYDQASDDGRDGYLDYPSRLFERKLGG